MRYSDIENLKPENIINIETSDGLQPIIKITMHKTKEPVSIPVIPKANEILITGVVFKKHTNQYLNRCLKDIAKLAGINENLTFHIARHTFATIAINKGIPIEVVSKLLGHTQIKTTEIYAKVR